jgi:hypothetical protein
MYTDEDHFLGALLAASFELMLGDKVLISHCGGCPHGFFADIFASFPPSKGYFPPVKEHMQNFFKDKAFSLLEMEPKNAKNFLLQKQKKRLAGLLDGQLRSTVKIILVGQSIYLTPLQSIGASLSEFTLDEIIPLDRGGVRVLGSRKGLEKKTNYHLEHLKELGVFYGEQFLWSPEGVSLKEKWLNIFKKFLSDNAVPVIDTGDFDKETFKKIRTFGLPFVTQLTQQMQVSVDDPFFGLKSLVRFTTDRFFLQVEPGEFEQGMSSCLRLIEKWTKIIGICGKFHRGDRGRVSWIITDPYGAEFEGPFVERHPSGCITGSLMGPLELLIAIHAEEKLTWNLENQESTNKSVFHKSV